MGETNAQGADVSLAPMGESVVCRVYSAPYRIPHLIGTNCKPIKLARKVQG